MKDLEFDSYGFPKSSGIFETIKTIKGNPIALGRHMRRALASGLELGISIPSEDVVRSEILRTIQQNPQEVGRLRLCFGKEFLHVSHDPYIESNEPARLNFYTQTVIGAVHKTFPYDYRFALIEAAHQEGFHDTILFNDKNEITETAVSNIIFFIAGEWVTPPITSGILPGVVRAIAIEECGVKVRPVHVSEIPDVESAILVSSLRIAQPISHIGDMKLRLGQAAQDLQDQIRTHSQPVSIG